MVSKTLVKSDVVYFTGLYYLCLLLLYGPAECVLLGIFFLLVLKISTTGLIDFNQLDISLKIIKKHPHYYEVFSARK